MFFVFLNRDNFQLIFIESYYNFVIQSFDPYKAQIFV